MALRLRGEAERTIRGERRQSDSTPNKKATRDVEASKRGQAAQEVDTMQSLAFCGRVPISVRRPCRVAFRRSYEVWPTSVAIKASLGLSARNGHIIPDKGVAMANATATVTALCLRYGRRRHAEESPS